MTQPSWPQVDRYQQRKRRSLWCSWRCFFKGWNRFSATPPLETLRILLSVACQENVFRVEDPFLISIADVSRAHFYADSVRDVYVRLPDEDPKPTQPGVCGTLRKTLYGSLHAAQRWREQYAQVLETGGSSHGPNRTAILRCLVMQTLLDATPRENPVLRCEWPIRDSVVQDCGNLGLEQRRVRIGSGGEGSNRRYGTAVNFERLLFVWPCGNQI